MPWVLEFIIKKRDVLTFKKIVSCYFVSAVAVEAGPDGFAFLPLSQLTNNGLVVKLIA